MKWLTSAAIVYGAMFIVTFGHSAANQLNCRDQPTAGFSRDCESVSGLMAATFWPLYWSWVAFDAARAKEGGQ